jgi:hypothetical protein
LTFGPRARARLVPVTLAAGLAVAGLLTGPVSAAAAAPTPAAPAPVPGEQAASCFWTGPTGQLDVPDDNYAFPDSGARYYFSIFTMPAGARIVLNGKFAHARYQSLNSYNALTAGPTDALNDAATVPDPGSANPFLPGALRGAEAGRDYTATVVDQAPPSTAADRATNTLYAGVPGQPQVTLIYRLYVTDKNRDATGGVGLPAPTVQLADGSTVSGGAVCDALQVQKVAKLPVTSLPVGQYWFLRNPATNPLATRPGFPAFASPVWRAYYNSKFDIACAYLGACSNGAVRIGGQYSNKDNSYVATYASRDLGQVLVLHGKLPVTPRTWQRRPFMPADTDMRYWSICSNESYVTTRATACLYDEQIITDAHGWYTIAVSLPADRPATADAAHGINWLSLSPNGDGLCTATAGALPCNPDTLLIIRNMLPSPGFGHAAQDTKVPGDEAAVMGDYLPTGSYMSSAAFDAAHAG